MAVRRSAIWEYVLNLLPKVTLKTASEEDSKEVTPTPETEDKSEGETRENLIYDSEDNSKVEKTSDQKK